MRWAFRTVMLLSLLGLLSACGDPIPSGKNKKLEDERRAVVPPDAEPDTSKDHNVVVIIETSKGKIKAELFAEKAPITVQNFLRYVDDKFYDGTIFHRVIADFMIQGGGMLPGLNEKKTRQPIENEAGNFLSNKRGTLAMARTGMPNSATSQFYINVEDNAKRGLDRATSRDRVGYAVFGKVIEGMDVVDAIRMVKTETDSAKGMENVPVEDVFIKSIRREKQ